MRLVIEDTEAVNYDPCIRINVILEEILPRIEVKSNITVHALAKLEARTWKLASFTEIDEAGLMKIWNKFRSLGKKGYDDRIEIWAILREKRFQQAKLSDFLVAYT